LGLVLYFWYILEERDLYSHSTVEFYWLAVGNLIYYIVGILLALLLKDNRAFCKYICPIPVFQKIGARFSLLKIEIDPQKCIDCKLCELNCPMDIKLLDYKNKNMRVLSTECIQCSTCINICPKSAIDTTFRFGDTSKASTTSVN
jgi:polyferredoxin